MAGAGKGEARLILEVGETSMFVVRAAAPRTITAAAILADTLPLLQRELTANLQRAHEREQRP